ILGVGGRPLLALQARSDAVRAPRQAAGLFHTAFLLPSRADLAHWLAHAAERNFRLNGASDHLVSEALYMTDPEGNGIEIYRDREPGEWTYNADGTVEMATERLDLQALHADAPKSAWNGMANGTAVGHIHLQVGNVPQAEAFCRVVLGLTVMAHDPGASFMATGGYHHHVAANSWNSRGALAREGNMTGLSGYTLHFNDKAAMETALTALDTQEIATERSSDGVSIRDPWGIGLTLSA